MKCCIQKSQNLFAEALKTCFNNEVLEFCKKVLGENGSVIYKSLDITNNDDIMTARVCRFNF